MARRTTWLIDMGDGTWAVSAAWPAASPCTAAPRPAPTAPPAATTANPSSPSAAAAGRPDHVAHPGPRCGGAIPDPTRGRTRRPPPTHPIVKEQAREPSHRLGPAAHRLGPAPLPGWAPLVDPGPRPLHAARSVGRWLVADPDRRRLPGRRRLQVLDHDDPAPGLSGPWPADRRPGRRRGRPAHHPPPLRAAAAGPGRWPSTRWWPCWPPCWPPPASPSTSQPTAHQASGQAQAQAAAGDDQPAVIRAVTKVLRAGAGRSSAITDAVRWLVDLWRQAEPAGRARQRARRWPPRPTPRPRLPPRSGGPTPDVVIAALEPAHRARHRPAARPGRRRRRLHPVVLRPPRRRPRSGPGLGLRARLAVPHRGRHGPGLLRGPAPGRLHGPRHRPRPGRAVPAGHPVPAHAGRRRRHPVLQRHPRPRAGPPPRPGRAGGQHPGHPRPGLPAQDAGRRLRRRRHPPRSPGHRSPTASSATRRAPRRARPRPPGPRRRPRPVRADAHMGAFATRPKRPAGGGR